MRRFLLFVIWLAYVVNGYSQSSTNQSSITGIVLDQYGAAIAGAKIDLSIGEIKQQSTTTDGSGNFRFNRVSLAVYKILVTNEGFEPPVY